MLKRITDALIRIVYPRMCGSCGKPIERIDLGASCDVCWKHTRILTGLEPSCAKCGVLLSGSAATSAETATTMCGRCDRHSYDRVFSVGLYEKALKAEVLNLKKEPFLGRTAVISLESAFERIVPKPEMLIPVPLSRRRLKERGFNQAELIATALGRMSGLDVCADVLKRITHTPIHRAGMDSKAREVTVRRAFVVEDAAQVEGRHVLLIDDVFTSGATSSQCGGTLKEAGVRSVDVLTLARTR
jgi:ComF family protein